MNDPSLDRELTEVVRRWARPTTPEELSARGVQTLRSVSMSRVAGLLEKAVNRALNRRASGEALDARGEFSRSAREEFVRLLGEERALAEAPPPLEAVAPAPPAEVTPTPAPTPAEAGSALQRLKRSLAERRQELDHEQASLAGEPGVPGDEDSELAARLERLFRAWSTDHPIPKTLERDVVALSVGALRQERRRSRQSLLDQHRQEVGLLERRVSKLNRELQRTSEELQLAVARGIGAQEDGVASIFDSVQGLSSKDGQFEQKTSLMSAIFEANIQLRAKLDTPPAAAG